MSDKQDILEYMTSTMAKDFFYLMAGDVLGRGAYRIVTENTMDPTTVIKWELGAGCFNNVKEWEIWNEVKGFTDKEIVKWFAPCEYISQHGGILIQKKTTKVAPENYPTMLPKHFLDTKYANFGSINGQFCCHDYGNTSLANGINKKLVKADWW